MKLIKESLEVITNEVKIIAIETIIAADNAVKKEMESHPDLLDLVIEAEPGFAQFTSP